MPDHSQPLSSARLSHYVSQVMEDLCAFQTSDLGFRPTGSSAAHAAAGYLEAGMRRIGLSDVRTEQFPVTGWDFKTASLRLRGSVSETITASTYAGVAGTGPDGLSGEIIAVGSGRLQDYERSDPSGKVVLIDWSFDDGAWLSLPLTEAAERGAIAAIIYSTSTLAQEPGAMNCHNSKLGLGSIPVINIPRVDGERLVERAARGPVEATIYIDAAVVPEATGGNVIGMIPGSTWPDQYVLVGAHYDAWFRGFMDNASGTAMMLAVARAILESGRRPQRSVVFVAHDAEEFGALGTDFDFCLGSHWLITRSHPDWVGKIVAYLNVDTLGYRNDREFGILCTPDLLSFLGDAGEKAVPLDGYPDGLKVVPEPSVWTDAWPYATAGVPAFQNGWPAEGFFDHIYHTQYDDHANFDLAKMPANIEVYSDLVGELASCTVPPYSFTPPLDRLVHSLDRTELGGERAGDLRRATLGARASWEQVERRLKMAGCTATDPESAANLSVLLMEAAAILNRGLLTLGGERAKAPVLYHEHYANDAQALERALQALQDGDRNAASHELEGVFSLSFGRNYSHATYRTQFLNRVQPDRPDLAWGTNRLPAFTDVHPEYSVLSSATENIGWVADSIVLKHASALDNLHLSIASTEGVIQQFMGVMSRIQAAIGSE